MSKDDAALLAAMPTFVAHALNELWVAEEGCCPECCAPCGALRDLTRVGLLDAAVRPYVRQDGPVDWWMGSADTGHVKRFSMRKRWLDPPCKEQHVERGKQS